MLCSFATRFITGECLSFTVDSDLTLAIKPRDVRVMYASTLGSTQVGAAWLQGKGAYNQPLACSTTRAQGSLMASQHASLGMASLTVLRM